MNNSTKAVRLVVAGAAGRMGTRIIDLASKDSRFQVVAGVEAPGSRAVGHFIPNTRVPIVGDLKEVLHNADVVIDFTSPEAALQTALWTARAKKGFVLGTTGLNSAAQTKLKNLSKTVPIVFSPNMSVGVNLLFQLVEMAAGKLAHYDIEIVEAHHNQKKDAPSGTAMKLADIAAEASHRSRKDFVFGREGLVGARKKKEIGVLAVRGGDIVGDHTVYLTGQGERLELIHRAHSRDALALGALTAAAWVFGRRPGFYNMQDVLKG